MSTETQAPTTLRATVVAQQSPAGRRSAAMRGLPATEYVLIPDVPVPPSLHEHVYVGADGRAWLSLVRHTGVENLGVPRDAAMLAVPQGYDPRYGSADHPVWDEPPADVAAWLAELAERLPVEHARIQAALDQERARQEREQQEREAEHLAACSLVLDELEALDDGALVARVGPKNTGGEIPGARQMSLSGFNVPRPLRDRMSRVQQRVRDEHARRERVAAEERAAWIREHGSVRLRRLLAEQIEHAAVYRSERLAAERPGWAWDTMPGEASEPRNPPEGALDLLDEARKTAPDARLVYWTVERKRETDPDDYEDEDEVDRTVRGYTCAASFLGRDIVFRVPVDGTPPVLAS